MREWPGASCVHSQRMIFDHTLYCDLLYSAGGRSQSIRLARSGSNDREYHPYQRSTVHAQPLMLHATKVSRYLVCLCMCHIAPLDSFLTVESLNHVRPPPSPAASFVDTFPPQLIDHVYAYAPPLVLLPQEPSPSVRHPLAISIDEYFL